MSNDDTSGPTVTDCRFTNNVAGGSGGGIQANGDFTLINSECCGNLPNDVVTTSFTMSSDCDPCPADIDRDGTVGVSDFLALLAAWGVCP